MAANTIDKLQFLSFILYNGGPHLADVAAEHNMSLDAYAGNSQVHIHSHCQPEDVQSAYSSVSQSSSSR